VPELSRSQALVYGAIGVALLLLGARWVRGADDGAAAGEPAIAVADGAKGEAAEGSFSLDGGGDDLVVHVAGAVRDPGVYRLPEGSRVTDAVDRAGGATGEGATDAINLAARLADGQQVVVPVDPPGAAAPGAVAAGSTAAEGPISLGTATVEQLDTIEGIGPVTAQDIIEFRDQNGGLSSVEELDEISGIGPATMEALRESLQP
jgi:competence protein ComEA